MIAVHHLNESRPQRILCLLEELREIHPHGKSPVITEGDRIIAESETIID
jgi:glutathione S-transferase